MEFLDALVHYWDLFVQAEAEDLRNFVRRMQIYASGRPDPYYYFRFFATWLLLLGLFVGEFAFPWHKQSRRREGLGLDFFYIIVNTWLLYALIGNAVFQVGVIAFHDVLKAWFGITNLVAIELAGLPMWSRFALLLLIGDLWGYFGHWLLHRVGFLWEFHKIHHSSKQLDVWNAQRFHFGEQMFWPFFKYLPMALIGFPAGEAYFAGLFFQLLSSYTHANIKIPLGPLKYILNNPQLHIWHHAAAVDPQRNVNYGDSLAVWDYLFGTAYLPPEREDLVLGFDDISEFPIGLTGQTAYPFKAIFKNTARGLASLSNRVRSSFPR